MQVLHFTTYLKEILLHSSINNIKDLTWGRHFMRALFFSIIVLSWVSCGRLDLKRKDLIVPNSKIRQSLDIDFIDQLKNNAQIYLESNKNKIIKLSRRNNEYLKRIVTNIVDNNELLLPRPKKVSIYIINHKAPFIFSLPGYQIFISKGLIKKYLTNESILICALAYEVIKSGRNIYQKNNYIPTGYIDTKKVSKMVKINSSNRLTIFKWTFIALQRSNYDATAVLNWIQTINRNNTEFSWQIGDTQGVLGEEFQFKTFLASQGLEINPDSTFSSSRSFYLLRGGI